jgi:hypothetical protein
VETIETWPKYIARVPFIDNDGVWHKNGVVEYATINPELSAVVVDVHG